MSKIQGTSLYLECNGGISGDMTVAALLDLGADAEVLQKVLESIPAKGFRTEISRVKKAGIDCSDFRVILDEACENHDHDMEYLHGHEAGQAHSHNHHEHHHGHSHEHFHEHNDEHSHEHGHAHEHEHTHEHAQGHLHRGIKEITDILNQTEMSPQSRETALRIFDILAEAEAKAHAVPKEQVHFHEVGAIDSIVDIVAAAVCLDNLSVKEVIITELCEGKGTVRCQHGILPVPVPATANILEASGIPLHIMECNGEFVTPTGAAIAAAIRTSGKLPERFIIRKTGFGAGKREYDRPSILRAMLIEEADHEKDEIIKLETNVDDCTGEVLGYTMEKLFEAGAKDVHYTPVYMKKNRPGWQLNVICDKEQVSLMEEIIFKHTTTIGIRKIRCNRTVLKRENRMVDTPFGRVQVKMCHTPDGLRGYPEYESVAAICREKDLSFSEVYHKIEECIK